MRKFGYLLVFMFAVGFIGWTATLQAEELALAERFAGDVKGEPGTYSFDKAHSFIGFKVKHMGLVEVPGYFRDFTGEVSYDASDIRKSAVNFKAMVTSIDTGVAGRDRHLRTADFFEVEKFPEMTFKSTKVEKKGKGMIVTGDLTIKGVTKQVAIPFQISGWLPATERSAMKMGIVGETTVNRRDYGINYGGNLPNGIPSIADEVKVVVAIEAAKAK